LVGRDATSVCCRMGCDIRLVMSRTISLS
jgi:hypothetical protein